MLTSTFIPKNCSVIW